MGRIKDFFQKCLPVKKKGRSKNDCLLILDIGTEFVKALIFKIEPTSGTEEKKKQGIVIGLGREQQTPGQMLAGAVTDIEGVVATCQKAIKQAAVLAHCQPKQVVIGVAGEYIKGNTANFLYQRQNPAEEIDLAELKNIIQKIQWKAYDQIRCRLAEEISRPEIAIKPINGLINEIRIDNHQVTNPLGFQGKEIFLSIFNAYAPLIHLRALEAIAKKLNLELLSVVAEPYALTRSSGFNPGSGAIFIDVGGGTTDIALVRQNSLEGIRSLALAGQTFTKRLSQNFGLDFTEAEKIKLKHAGQQLSQAVQFKIRQILKRDIRTWLAGVELILEEFNQANFFPPSILLCGGGSLLPAIRNILKSEAVQNNWLNRFPFPQPPQVNYLRVDHMTDIIDQTGLLKGSEMVTPAALASLALEIATEKETVLPLLLRRIIRLMQ